MGKKNKCMAVPNFGVAGKERIACSKCGIVWPNGIPLSCPNCHRHVKKSKTATKFN